MVRSLWSAASGMYAQQISLDNISNNISNINTVGFKTQTVEFKSLLYQELKHKSTDSEGKPKPIGIQVGSGVRDASITGIFTEGNAQNTEQKFDFMLEGKGFFAVSKFGNTAYTRNGHFGLSAAPGGGWILTNSDGYPVLDTNGNSIAIDKTWDTDDISVDQVGNIKHNVENADGSISTNQVARIAVYQFNNPAGLDREGDSLFTETDASGTPRLEATDAGLEKSKVVQGYLESSNVQAADEMVNMIVTQRAYQLNSKAIQTSDEMLQIANELKR